MKSHFFQEQLQAVQAEAAQDEHESTVWVRRRTLIAVAVFLSLAAAWRGRLPVIYILTAFLLVIFGYSVQRHHRVKQKIAAGKRRTAVLERYLKRCSGETGVPESCGLQFVESADAVAQDLDLFGVGSLFQSLCVADSSTGQALLAERLRRPADVLVPQELIREQAAVRELADEADFCIRFQAVSHLLEAGGAATADETFIKMAERPPAALPGALKILKWLLPVLTIGGLLAILCGVQGLLFRLFAAGGAALQLLLNLFYRRIHVELFEHAGAFSRKLSDLETVIMLITERAWQTEGNRKLVQNIRDGAAVQEAAAAMRRIGYGVTLRRNEVFSLVLNAFLMWDFHLNASFRTWQSRFGSRVRDWIRSIGEMEVRISLAVPAQVREVVCWPVIKAAPEPQITATDLMHPLIREGQAIGNDVSFKSGIAIITGSNMSGKTTLLRTLGVNAVLAYAGAPVAAAACTLSLMRIFTSMRVGDNIGTGESTFYAELKRIREMIEYVHRQRPMLALIDEIFKGTNSADRIVGAEATLRKLHLPWVLALVSTHDFELCELENDPVVQATNHHFSEYYVKDRIFFDYKMKSGRCQTTNARYLLRMAGILEQPSDPAEPFRSVDFE